MKPRNYFPLGKAYAIAFCNRVRETKWLIGNIDSAKHSLLIAPRRFGKSSLAEHALKKAKLPFVRANFHVCTTEEEITDLILDSTIDLIGKTIGPLEKGMNLIKKYLSNITPKLSFGGKHAKLELIPESKKNLALIITEALMLIENLLREKNQHAVLFFDEFQEIAKIAAKPNIEGGIRTAAQEMQHLSIIFSGSIRSLLLSMFDDERRPLYRLCRKLKLQRISAEDYYKHINAIAMHTWQQQLEDEVFNEIMSLSNRHPYYVNYLCDMIWQECERPPTIKNVVQCWKWVIEEERSDILRELSSIAITQRRVLKLLAHEPVAKITSQQISTQINLAPSSIASAINALAEKDYIEHDEQGYIIINPLMRDIISE